MNDTNAISPTDANDSSETPIADSVHARLDISDALAEVVKAINTQGEQLNWLCDSHFNILQTVGAIQEKMSSMGPGGMLKAMMGGGKG